MTLESRTNKNRYIGNGSTKTFPFTFKTWKEDQIKVFVGDGSTEVDMTQRVSVSRTETGGSITFTQAPASGRIIVVRRDMPYIQEDDYRNGTRFDSEEIEDRLDQDCAERQDLLLGLERCVKVPETSSASGDLLVSDLMQARQDVIWALEHAGDVTGATRVTATGSTTARAIQDRFSDFINVKDFGAKGDGTADDTAAIQAALNAGANATVFFPKGVYCISDTLLVNGDTDGSYVFLGESCLKWIGESITTDQDYIDAAAAVLPSGKTYGDLAYWVRYNIETYGAAYFGTCMMYIRRLSGNVVGSRCIVEGGIFDGNSIVDVAVKTDGFVTLLHGLRIQNVRKIGIMLGQDGIDGAGGLRYEDSTGTAVGMRSYQTMVSDCHLCRYPAALGMSHGDSIGIYVDGLDSQFSNNNICWFGYGMVFRGSGHYVSNSHITIEYPYVTREDSDGETRTYFSNAAGDGVLSEYPDNANILVDPCVRRSISGHNALVNCYFNGGKYVVYYALGARYISGYSLCTDFVGCTYFLKSDSVYLSLQNTAMPNTDPIPAYLCAGEQAETVHFSAFNVWVLSRFVVRDYFPSAAISDAVISQNRIDTVKNGIPGDFVSAGSSFVITAENLMPCGYGVPVMLSSYSSAIPSGKYARIGCVFVRIPISEGTTLLHIPPVKIAYNNRNFREEERTITLNASTGIWASRVDETHEYSTTNITMFIDNTPEYITLNEQTYAYYNIYYGSPDSSVDGVTFASIYSTGHTVSIYMHQAPRDNTRDLRSDAPGSNDTVIF